MYVKKRVGILYGGKSPEHKISLMSVQKVVAHIDRDRFDVVLLPIDKEGQWHYQPGLLVLHDKDDPAKISLPSYSDSIYLSQNAGDGSIISKTTGKILDKVDILFPMLHGANGEDGAIQGLAKICDLACVGCGILGAAIGMDKDVTKRLLRDAGIRVADFVTLRMGYNDDMTYDEISAKIGRKMFLKPANLGSSVGVKYVDNEVDFAQAIKTCMTYDPKVIVEEKIEGREIECAVMGNQIPKASIPGEVMPASEWYTFESKYLDKDGAKLRVPADIPPQKAEEIRQIAKKVYVTLECKGMTRVDVFLPPDGTIIVNEVNTIPGFTKGSLYPVMWEKSGIDNKQLISALIDFAVARHTVTTNLAV